MHIHSAYFTIYGTWYSVHSQTIWQYNLFFSFSFICAFMYFINFFRNFKKKHNFLLMQSLAPLPVFWVQMYCTFLIDEYLSAAEFFRLTQYYDYEEMKAHGSFCCRTVLEETCRTYHLLLHRMDVGSHPCTGPLILISSTEKNFSSCM
jgi:hypothetical protein